MDINIIPPHSVSRFYHNKPLIHTYFRIAMLLKQQLPLYLKEMLEEIHMQLSMILLKYRIMKVTNSTSKTQSSQSSTLSSNISFLPISITSFTSSLILLPFSLFPILTPPVKIPIMAKTKTSKGGNNVTGFLGEVRQELRHVTWPTRHEAIQKTTLVVLISVVAGIYLGALDYAFTYITSIIYR